MATLCVAARVIVPLFGLPVALEAVAFLPQKLGHALVAGRMAPGGQLGSQRTGALVRLVTNEAMAAGLPALVSQACGSGELVCEGENGFWFDSMSQRDLLDLMARLRRDEGRLGEMGRASRRIIDERALSALAKGLVEAIEIGEEHLSRQGPSPLPNPALWF